MECERTGSGAAFVEKLGWTRSCAAEAANLLTREIRTAPTLVKYAEPNQYLMQTRAELEQAAAELLKGNCTGRCASCRSGRAYRIAGGRTCGDALYWASHHPYRQVRDIVAGLSEGRVSEIIELGLKHRGRHDETLRVFHAGAALRFDILMDIGGFRDMHRHRRVTQIKQGFTAVHGYDTPHSGDAAGLEEAGVLADYQSAIECSPRSQRKDRGWLRAGGRCFGALLLPLATRVRCLFKMDFAEAQYISELRSAPAGHFSYRRVAWEMYLALERQHPTLAKYMRVTDFSKPIDLLQR